MLGPIETQVHRDSLKVPAPIESLQVLVLINFLEILALTGTQVLDLLEVLLLVEAQAPTDIQIPLGHLEVPLPGGLQIPTETLELFTVKLLLLLNSDLLSLSTSILNGMS